MLSYIQYLVNFSRQAYLKFKDTIKYPESTKELRKFRGGTIAHINHDKASDIGGGIYIELIFLFISFNYIYLTCSETHYLIKINKKSLE